MKAKILILLLIVVIVNACSKNASSTKPQLSFGDVNATTFKLNSNIIFIGTDDGNVWKTIDGGTTYAKISTLLPNKWVTKVKASPVLEARPVRPITSAGSRRGRS